MSGSDVVINQFVVEIIQLFTEQMHQILGTELFIIYKSGDWPVIYHATFIKTNQYYNYVYDQLYQDIREA